MNPGFQRDDTGMWNAAAGGQKTCDKVIKSAIQIAAEIIMKKS